jgi:glucokinase
MTSAPTTIYAGVDLGGTNFTAALGGADGRILAEEKRPTKAHEGPASVLRRIGDTLEALVERAGGGPAAIGIGIPGLVDAGKGETRFLPNLPTQWRGVPVAAVLGGRFGCPVSLLNDARAAALGEARFGHGRQVRTMVLFTLGTGVGGGIVIDGVLRLGPLGAAGEIGHICVDPSGFLCGCGARGCLETVASGPALTAEGVRIALGGNAPHLYEMCGGDVSRISPQLLGEAARAGDTGAQAVLERAGDLLGMAASAVVLALHPELIVLGGGVASLGDLLIEPMHRSLGARVRMFPVDGVRIERSQLGERAGVLGGLAAAMGGGAGMTAVERAGDGAVPGARPARSRRVK